MIDSGGSNQEVELNLAPIIDCFTVLITYLLVTASFLTFAAVDVGVSANNPSESTPVPLDDKRPMTMTMDVDLSSQISIKVSGGTLTTDYEIKIPGKTGNFDEGSLQKNLENLRARFSTLKEVSVSAAPAVKYKDLVNIINATQKTLPKVFISGG